MKRILTFFLLIAFAFTTQAQEVWCGTDDVKQNIYDTYPEVKAFKQQKDEEIRNFRPVNQKSNHKTIIPLVVHVFHYNGQGNISDAQILDGIRILNEDFNKLNSDTNTIRPVFQGVSESMDIEFRLAQIDPNNNCTNGITRTNTHRTFTANDNIKSLSTWDPNRYLNVWLVVNFGPPIAPTVYGYAYPPSVVSNPTLFQRYGLILRSDSWGSIGSASSTTFNGRVGGHEIGHCLNLDHPFERGCDASFNCQIGGDQVCDTPPQASSHNNACSSAINSCSNDANGGTTNNPNPYSGNVPDQLENIMGYGIGGGCMVMLSGGQKARMDAAIALYSQLSNMTSATNLASTGTNDNYSAAPCVPTAEIIAFDRFVCEGSSLTFSDDSYGGPITSHSWSFPGGTPSSSTQAQPTITYNTKGTYDVVLRVSNASGTDSIVLQDYVHVDGTIAGRSGFNYIESFENATTFTNEWIIINSSPNPDWTRASFAGKTGSASVWNNNLNKVYEGGKERLISPSLDMNDVLNPSISVEVAYRRKNTNSNDKLNILASLDCGNTWLNILSTTPAFFAYDNNTQTTNFFPTQGTQWRTVTIPSQFLPAAVKSSDRVRFMFELENGDGNNMFIDDFQILGLPTSIDKNKVAEKVELLIYPNPAEDRINVVYAAKTGGQHHIYLRNMLGERVLEVFNGSMQAKEYRFSIDGTQLSKGVYFLSVEGGNDRITQKVVIR